MKTILVIAAFLLTLLGGCARATPRTTIAPAPASPTERVDRVVLVEAFCLQGDPFLLPPDSDRGIGVGVGVARGSGVILGSGRVLTSLHVVECPYLLDAHVITRDGRRARATVVREWRARDLALMDAPGLGRSRDIPLGEIAVGAEACSGHASPSRGGNCGKIETIQTEPTCTRSPEGGRTWCRDLRWSGIAASGNSGGPLWDARGHLVGIVTGGSHILGVAVDGGFASAVWAVRDQLGISATRPAQP